MGSSKTKQTRGSTKQSTSVPKISLSAIVHMGAACALLILAISDAHQCATPNTNEPYKRRGGPTGLSARTASANFHGSLSANAAESTSHSLCSSSRPAACRRAHVLYGHGYNNGSPLEVCTMLSQCFLSVSALPPWRSCSIPM